MFRKVFVRDTMLCNTSQNGRSPSKLFSMVVEKPIFIHITTRRRYSNQTRRTSYSDRNTNSVGDRPRPAKTGYSGHFGGRSRSQANTMNVSNNMSISRDGFESIFVSISDTKQGGNRNGNNAPSSNRKVDYRGTGSRKAKASKVSVADLNGVVSVNRTEAVRIILDMTTTSEAARSFDADEEERGMSMSEDVSSNEFSPHNSAKINTLSQALRRNTSFLSAVSLEELATIGTENSTTVAFNNTLGSSELLALQNEDTMNRTDILPMEKDGLLRDVNEILSRRANSPSIVPYCEKLLNFYCDYQQRLVTDTEAGVLAEQTLLNLSASEKLALSPEVLLRVFSVFLFKDLLSQALDVCCCASRHHAALQLPLSLAFSDKLFAYFSLKHDGQSIFELHNLFSQYKINIPTPLHQKNALHTSASSDKNTQESQVEQENNKTNKAQFEKLEKDSSVNSKQTLALLRVCFPSTPSTTSQYSYLLSQYAYSCVTREAIRVGYSREIVHLVTVEMPSRGIIPQPSLLLQAARLLTQQQGVDAALDFISPQVYRFPRMARAQFVALFVNAHIKAGNPEKGISILNMFGEAANLFVDEGFIASTMRTLVQVGRAQMAEELFYRFAVPAPLPSSIMTPTNSDGDDSSIPTVQVLRKPSSLHKGGFTPTMISLNVLLEQRLAEKDFAKALTFLREAIHRGISPSLSTLNHFLTYAVRQRDLKMAMVVLRYMFSKGYDVDLEILQSIIRLCALAALDGTTTRTLYELEGQELGESLMETIKPAVLAAQQIDAILAFVTSKQMQISHTLVEAVIESYCMIGRLEEAMKICEHDAKLVYKVRTTDSMYNAIIKQASTHGKMQSAIRFIQLLGNHNLQNSASFTYKKNKWVLFHALTSAIQRKDAGAANTIFEILKSNNVTIKENLVHSFIEMMQREGEYKIATMVKKETQKKKQGTTSVVSDSSLVGNSLSQTPSQGGTSKKNRYLQKEQSVSR